MAKNGFDGWSPLPPPPRWLLVTAACIRQAGAVLSAVRGQSEDTALDKRQWRGVKPPGVVSEEQKVH